MYVLVWYKATLEGILPWLSLCRILVSRGRKEFASAAIHSRYTSGGTGSYSRSTWQPVWKQICPVYRVCPVYKCPVYRECAVYSKFSYNPESRCWAMLNHIAQTMQRKSWWTLLLHYRSMSRRGHSLYTSFHSTRRALSDKSDLNEINHIIIILRWPISLIHWKGSVILYIHAPVRIHGVTCTTTTSDVVVAYNSSGPCNLMLSGHAND